MLSAASRIIYSRVFFNSKICNAIRKQSFQSLQCKDAAVLSVPTRSYINNHGSYTLSSFSKEKINVMALDEDEKEIGVVKFSRLKSLAVERGMQVEVVDQTAQPHPIYKLVTTKKPTHEVKVNAAKKLNAKEQTKDKVKKVHKKSLRLKPSISKNDLKVKVDHVLEWLLKGCVVSIRISIAPDDKKHTQVYEEIMKAVTSIATSSKPISSDKELTFELVSTSTTTTTDPLEAPVKSETVKHVKGGKGVETTVK